MTLVPFFQKMTKHKIRHKNYKKYFAILGVLIIIFFGVLYTLVTNLDGAKKEAQILFVGDMFFDRQIRKVISNKGGDYIFDCLDNYLKEFDLVVGNLEGPITDNPSVSLGSEIGSPQNFVFTFPPLTAKLLHKNNVKVVSLSNNHIGNFGGEGIAATHKYLDQAGVKYFGGILGNEPILRKTVSAINFSFVSYNQFGGKNSEQVAQDIKSEKTNQRKENRKVIVFAHWGEEYTAPTEHMKQTAKLFADSGADLIIGAHPHVIQESEKIGDTLVYYSLGNFIFDQYWNKEVSTGLGVVATFSKNNLSISEQKFEIERTGQTCRQN